MKSTLDIIDILYTHLNVSDITNVISGKVYKQQRPLDSKLEDVVIGSLPITNDQLQRCVANVNIHVPNLTVVSNGFQDDTQPNFARLRTLTALVITKVNDILDNDNYFDVQQQNVFTEENINEHYSNIRLNFYSNI